MTTGMTAQPEKGSEPSREPHDDKKLVERLRAKRYVEESPSNLYDEAAAAIERLAAPSPEIERIVGEIDGLFAKATAGPFELVEEKAQTKGGNFTVSAGPRLVIKSKTVPAWATTNKPNDLALIVALLNAWPALRAALKSRGDRE